jgi:hypothetical protein
VVSGVVRGTIAVENGTGSVMVTSASSVGELISEVEPIHESPPVYSSKKPEIPYKNEESKTG